MDKWKFLWHKKSSSMAYTMYLIEVVGCLFKGKASSFFPHWSRKKRCSCPVVREGWGAELKIYNIVIMLYLMYIAIFVVIFRYVNKVSSKISSSSPDLTISFDCWFDYILYTVFKQLLLQMTSIVWLEI